MENIQLEGRTIEPAYGRSVDTIPALLTRYENGEGIIPSEVDIRLLGVRNFGNAPELATNYWDTSTLSATKGKTVKVILPYEKDSRTLAEIARFGLGLINPKEDLIDGGVNLDIEDRWEKLQGSGVYTNQIDEWFEEEEKGRLVGLNDDMTEEQAGKCPLLLTKLQHPDYVDSEFARSRDEVTEIIGKTFELGKQEHGFDTMMTQSLLDVDDKGILKVWYINSLGGGARSGVGAYLCDVSGRFAFESVSEAKSEQRLESRVGGCGVR